MEAATHDMPIPSRAVRTLPVRPTPEAGEDLLAWVQRTATRIRTTPANLAWILGIVPPSVIDAEIDDDAPLTAVHLERIDVETVAYAARLPVTVVSEMHSAMLERYDLSS